MGKKLEDARLVIAAAEYAALQERYNRLFDIKNSMRDELLETGESLHDTKFFGGIAMIVVAFVMFGVGSVSTHDDFTGVDPKTRYVRVRDGQEVLFAEMGFADKGTFDPKTGGALVKAYDRHTGKIVDVSPLDTPNDADPPYGYARYKHFQDVLMSTFIKKMREAERSIPSVTIPKEKS